MKTFKRVYKKRVGQSSSFRAKRNPSEYKSIDSYLNEVWKRNKGSLENKLFKPPAERRTDRQLFKDKVKEFMQEINPETGKKYSIKQALDRFQRSELVTSSERRRSEVSLSRIKAESPETWKEIRKKIGWRNKFDINNIVDSWTEGKINYYRYKDPNTGKDIMIAESISPKSGYNKTEVFEYNDWRLGYLKSKKEKTAADASEIAVLEVLTKGKRG